MPKIKKAAKKTSGLQTSVQFAAEIQRLHTQWKKHCEAEIKGSKKLITQLKDAIKKARTQGKATKGKKLASKGKSDKNRNLQQQIAGKIRLLANELKSAQDYLRNLKIRLQHSLSSEKAINAVAKNFDKKEKSTSKKKAIKKTGKRKTSKKAKKAKASHSKNSFSNEPKNLNASNHLSDKNDYSTID